MGLLEKLGYTNLRYYVGGMADWLGSGNPVETVTSVIASPRAGQAMRSPNARKSSWTGFLDLLAGWSLERLVGFWLGMILVFGLIYWAAGIGMGWGLQAGAAGVKPDIEGLGTAIYFSFVTALSIGYGDVIPIGPLRVLAVAEGIAGLLIFGCVISKLVSRRQEELTAEIHRTTFDDRLDRVRTNLHLVFSDLGTVQQLQAEQGSLPGQVLRRLESTVRVFRGELQTVHDLLYRSQVIPDEEALAPLLENLLICLQSLVEFHGSRSNSDGQSIALDASSRAIGNLAREICGECVPHAFAPALKETMDKIQELANQIS